MKTRYITKDEFKEYTGIDLDIELKDDDNPSNKANTFLFKVEIRLATFLDANFARLIDDEYKEFSDYQKIHYKYALLEQALYVLKNHDISVDSGYDPENGKIISQRDLMSITISPNAKQHLMLCGMWCKKLSTKGRLGIEGWLK